MKVKDLKIQSKFYKVFRDNVTTVGIIALELDRFTYAWKGTGTVDIVEYKDTDNINSESVFPIKYNNFVLCTTIEEANDAVKEFYEKELKKLSTEELNLHVKILNIEIKLNLLK